MRRKGGEFTSIRDDEERRGDMCTMGPRNVSAGSNLGSQLGTQPQGSDPSFDQMLAQTQALMAQARAQSFRTTEVYTKHETKNKATQRFAV